MTSSVPRCESCRKPFRDVFVVQIDEKAWHFRCVPKTLRGKFTVPEDRGRANEAEILNDLAEAKAAIAKQAPRPTPNIVLLQKVGADVVSTPLRLKPVVHSGRVTGLTTGLPEADRLASMFDRDVDQIEADLNETLGREAADRRAVAEGLPLPKVGEAGALRAKGASSNKRRAVTWRSAVDAIFRKLPDHQKRDYKAAALAIRQNLRGKNLELPKLPKPKLRPGDPVRPDPLIRYLREKFPPKKEKS